MARTWGPSCLTASVFSVKHIVKLSAKVAGKKRKHCVTVTLEARNQIY